jgi:hypothetical protein
VTDFQQRDPRSPAFWDERFARNFTPWDKGGVPQALRDLPPPAPLVTLIPGCGSAYELAFLPIWAGTPPPSTFPGRRGAGQSRRWQHAARVVEADFFQWQPARRCS